MTQVQGGTEWFSLLKRIFCSLVSSLSKIPKMATWPQDVGILAMHMVIPSCYVDQTELEKFYNVSAGKYTIGLAQDKMGFCTDVEDINSLCLTAVDQIMTKNNISYKDIGRLDVGTESIADKSKSVKTVIMQLFEESGNYDVEGIDSLNACYGGTAALMNAVNWIESSSWDGRLALVVAGDLAIYAEGVARATGGAGAVSILIGPNAPLVIERGLRATFMKHSYDFYKPNFTSLYPTVDGRLSIECYLNALDNCYQLYCQKARKISGLTCESNDPVGLNSLDAMIFHAPFGKLVEKSLARMVFNDFTSTPKERVPEVYPGLERFIGAKLEETYFDKEIEKGFMEFSKELFKRKTVPSLLLSNQVGNMYTASLYGSLVSLLISKKADDLAGSRVGLFSYGSGLASTMYSLKIVGGSKLNSLVDSLQYVHEALKTRTKFTPEDFTKCIEDREKFFCKPDFVPTSKQSCLFPNTWYLTGVDSAYRRKYAKYLGK